MGVYDLWLVRGRVPVFIEHVPKIMEMRRHLVLEEENRFPSEVIAVFNNLERNGKPWQYAQSRRDEWARGLGVRRWPRWPLRHRAGGHRGHRRGRTDGGGGLGCAGFRAVAGVAPRPRQQLRRLLGRRPLRRGAEGRRPGRRADGGPVEPAGGGRLASSWSSRRTGRGAAAGPPRRPGLSAQGFFASPAGSVPLQSGVPGPDGPGVAGKALDLAPARWRA